MLDIRRIRTDFDGVLAALARRGETSVEFELRRAVTLDERLRAIVAERDDVRAKINALSKQVGALRRDGKGAQAEALQEESRLLGEREKALAAEYDSVSSLLRDTLLAIPNLPSPDAPDGAGPDDNVVVKTVGFDPDAYGEHQRVPHWDIGVELGILDLERAAKLSGSMFALYRGHGARLLRALTQFALDRHTSGAGAYEEVRPPTLVRTETMIATGQLPKFADDAYHLERDDLWLIPTAEAPLTSMHRDEILDEGDLPRRFTAYTPCFRREAGSAGADTRGTLRSHEFDKVELFAYCTPEQASSVHDDILERASAIITDLGLAYRVLDLCTGDLGFSSARTFDLEVYSPGCDRWLEVSSVSWFSDYQARRANVRYRGAMSKGTELCHTLNGSALAWSRIWPAIVETYRQPDGSVLLPEVLHPYFNGVTAIERG
ncbi:MAG: seryl-tRNA synthetase [Acidimicrobiaceae bacterium]|jgi:seryl-tRNA synthetase